jgi:hypothetical protein
VAKKVKVVYGSLTKSVFLGGWMNECISHLKDCLQQSKTMLEKKTVTVELGESQP